MNKRSNERKSTTLGSSQSVSVLSCLSEPKPWMQKPPYSLWPVDEAPKGEVPMKTWLLLNSTQELGTIEFRATAGRVDVAQAEDVYISADLTGRWWLRHKIVTYVSVHSWKWVLTAQNSHGQVLFCLPRTSSERRRLGGGRAEFWGVDKNIAGCWHSIDTWTIAGFGDFQFDEE